MNTNATRLTHAVMTAATLAAALVIQPSAHAAPAAGDAAATVIVMPKVVVTGKRIAPMQVVHLPRVMVTGHRPDDGRALAAAQRGDSARPAVPMLVAAR